MEYLQRAACNVEPSIASSHHHINCRCIAKYHHNPMIIKKLFMSAALSSALISGLAHGQAASNFPARAVTLIVPFAAGGAIDGETRHYANKMTALTGQQFVIDYKTGAGGRIGVAHVAKAKPDGYTLLLANGSFTVYPAVDVDSSFDTIKDFEPISLMSQRTSVLVSSPSFGPRNFAEYMAYSKANPGKINYATTGSGSIGHLAPAWMHSITGTKVTFIHYKGAAPQLIDLTTGRVDVASGNILAQIPLIKAGKVRPLAILTNKRSKLMPDIPAATELIPGFSYTNWLGFVAPVGTPPAVLNKLSEGFIKISRDPELISALDAENITVVGSTPAQFRQHLATEVALWKKVIQENGIKVEE
jgi:tripartite-type tricarboxylate transporter receptor subunit TctC